MGERVVPVVSYPRNASGWTEDLTAFPENIAYNGTHYIDVASRNHTLDTIARWMPSPTPLIMDIGCSSGYLVHDLRRRFPEAMVVGADYIRTPLERLSAKIPDIPLLQFDLVECPLPDACIDVAVLLNVLEHIQDDAAAARQVFRVLKPGGIAVVELPYGPELYDVYDRLLMHFRRYTGGQVETLLRGAGFEILESSHLGFFLYPFFRAVKHRNQRLGSTAAPELQRRMVADNVARSGGNLLPSALLRLEALLRRRLSFPRGIRCLVTAIKR